jgi:serine/threonine protein kinase
MRFTAILAYAAWISEVGASSPKVKKSPLFRKSHHVSPSEDFYKDPVDSVDPKKISTIMTDSSPGDKTVVRKKPLAAIKVAYKVVEPDVVLQSGTMVKNPDKSSVDEFKNVDPLHNLKLSSIKSQKDIDNVLVQVKDAYDHMIPPNSKSWLNEKEYVPPGILETVNISMLYPAIYISKKTAVYNIKDDTKHVIKYYTFCQDDVDTFDPVVTEATFMKLLEGLDICPKIFHISGPLILDDPNFRNKYYGKVSQTTCDNYDGKGEYDGPIRYMIIEKVGPSLHQMMKEKGRIPFRQAIEYGIQMIGLLKILHSKNIIHGDAHIGNFATRLNKPNELMLIDFGRAKYIDIEVINSAKDGIKDFCKNQDWIQDTLVQKR